MESPPHIRRRVIAHVDMDCFYASVERQRFPHWRNAPIAVVQGGSLVVSSCHLARALGYPKMGPCDRFESLGHHIKFAGSDMNRYRQASRQWLEAYREFNNLVVVQKKSVDDALLDLTGLVKERIRNRDIKYLRAHPCPNEIEKQALLRHETAIKTYQEIESNQPEHMRESLGSLNVAKLVSRSTDPITASTRMHSQYNKNTQPVLVDEQKLQELIRFAFPVDWVRATKDQTIPVCLKDIGYNEQHEIKDMLEGIGSLFNPWIGVVHCAEEVPPVTFTEEDFVNETEDLMLCIGSQILFEMRVHVFEKTGFTTSGSVSCNPMLSKIASGLVKPNCQSVVRNGIRRKFMNSMELVKVPFFGPKAQNIVAETIGATLVSEIQNLHPEILLTKFDSNFGQWLLNIANGDDNTTVEVSLPPKSIGQSKRQITTSMEEKLALLDWCATHLTERIAEDKSIYRRRPTSIVLSWMDSQYSQMSRRASCPRLHKNFESCRIVFAIASDLLKKHVPFGSLRMLGITATNFVSLDNTNTLMAFMVDKQTATSNSKINSKRQYDHSSFTLQASETKKLETSNNICDFNIASMSTLSHDTNHNEYASRATSEISDFVCEECDLRLPISMKNEHGDWHFAKQLQKEIRRNDMTAREQQQQQLRSCPSGKAKHAIRNASSSLDRFWIHRTAK